MGRRLSRTRFAHANPVWLQCLAAAGILTVAVSLASCTGSTPSHSPTDTPASSSSPTGPLPTNAAPTTPVPAPGGGDVSHTASAAAPTSQSPVALSETATMPAVLTASLVKITDTAVKAQGPGEIAGPGLVVSLQVTNTSSSALTLDLISLTMTDSAGKPCSFVPTGDSHPLTGSLAPGASATGAYVFTVPTDKRSPITLGLIYGPSTSILLFTGTVR